MHFKAENFLSPTMYNLWGSMVIYLWITKNNDQICDSGLFLQNALVEYTGVLQTPIIICYTVVFNSKKGWNNKVYFLKICSIFLITLCSFVDFLHVFEVCSLKVTRSWLYFWGIWQISFPYDKFHFVFVFLGSFKVKLGYFWEENNTRGCFKHYPYIFHTFIYWKY